MNKRLASIVAASLLLVSGLGIAGFFYSPQPALADEEGTDLERQWTEQNNARIVKSVGFPNTPNALVKKQLRLVYELTDRGMDTYTYMRNPFTGGLRKICDSVGYPSAYSTQFSRAEEVDWYSGYRVVLPQAEPDGTYKPSSFSATYYLCKGKTGLYLEYEESNIHASSQQKKWEAQDEIIEPGAPLLTYAEMEKMKTLNGDELTTFLKAVADRIQNHTK
jgi:hypothetical protein